jgi:hypothetical protein
MKKISLFLSLLFILPAVFSQTIFMGKVTHQFRSDQDNMTGTVEVFYGDQKIRGIKRLDHIKHDYDNDDLLVDFSKGIIYHINTVQRTYTATDMKSGYGGKFPKLVAAPEKNIRLLNYQCNAFIIKSDDNRAVIDYGGFIFWYADSLYFPVSEPDLLTEDIALFTNGKNVGMGITANIKIEEKNIDAALIPVAVERMPVPDSIFEIPKDYVLEKPELDIHLDSVAKATGPPKKPVKKPVPQSGKKKVPVKAKVVGRKDTN